MAIEDVGHWWGGDLAVTATGDLARVSLETRSRQRVLRRLMTAQGEYICHLDYGGGLPQRVGDARDDAEITGEILTQMAMEPSVAVQPEPTIAIRTILNGVEVDLRYARDDGASAALTFQTV
jgi:hypothetical protein